MTCHSLTVVRRGADSLSHVSFPISFRGLLPGRLQLMPEELHWYWHCCWQDITIVIKHVRVTLQIMNGMVHSLMFEEHTSTTQKPSKYHMWAKRLHSNKALSSSKYQTTVCFSNITSEHHKLSDIISQQQCSCTTARVRAVSKHRYTTRKPTCWAEHSSTMRTRFCPILQQNFQPTFKT